MLLYGLWLSYYSYYVNAYEASFNKKHLTALSWYLNIHVLISLCSSFSLKLQVWDTAGQERFRSITQSYYHNADGVVIAYDITSPKSFESIEQWLEDVHRFTSKEVVLYIVGNKCDLHQQRQIDLRNAEEIAKKEKCVAMETSAKEADNVDNLFMSLATQLKRRLKSEDTQNRGPEPAVDGRAAGVTISGHNICSRGPMSCCRV